MIQAVHLLDRLYLDADGNVWPIVSLFAAGEETDDHEEADTAVAGAGDRWFCISLEGFVPATLN